MMHKRCDISETCLDCEYEELIDNPCEDCCHNYPCKFKQVIPK
jgi:hypothetical protein